jgi:beta-galactosidase
MAECSVMQRESSTRFLHSLTMAACLVGWASAAHLAAAPLTITLSTPPPASSAGFHPGTAHAPDGSTIEVDSDSLLLDGKRWTPVMGEFHFSRYPADEWREELIKMKEGGIDIVSTYVFWIHHEEQEGKWDWSGSRNLRKFIETAGEVGLKAIVRCGPWCHGEVRNGGTPDWVLKKGWRVRSNDPRYLEASKSLYKQIAAQLDGLLWKDGGPVIGVQLENEFKGPAEHLLRLKEIAQQVGLDVPLYTRTGWTDTRPPLPFGEILPLYGVYAEGFWDRSLEPMPGDYRKGFQFDSVRLDNNIAQDSRERRGEKAGSTARRYPFLTCEIGGGMMSAYHRRIRIDPRDVEATTLVKIGSGSNSPGYYMYHGGTNPEGKLTTLMENQDGNWNDMPVKNYDFQAPLGEFGQIRPHYYWLRRLHLFLHDFGAQLAEMATALPDVRPQGKDDVETLRWAVRSNGQSGFLFVNNYERLKKLPAKAAVQFQLELSDGNLLTIPSKPVDIPADAMFIWPFNFNLGHNLTLAWASTQPICFSDGDDTRTYYFAQTPGVAAEFAIVDPMSSTPTVIEAEPSRTPFWERDDGDGHAVRLVLLSESDSLLICQDRQGKVSFESPRANAVAIPLTIEKVQEAGPARTISLGKANPPVAAAPTDADFAEAAVWRVRLPSNLELSGNPLVRLHYVGDVARVFIDGKFVVDDFYNGDAFEIGLRRYAAELTGREIVVEILPLRKDAPIGFSPPDARPDFGDRDAIAELERAELVSE